MDTGVELLYKLCIQYIEVISDPTVGHQHMQLFLKERLPDREQLILDNIFCWRD